jgi:hypothetical protein
MASRMLGRRRLPPAALTSWVTTTTRTTPGGVGARAIALAGRALRPTGALERIDERAAATGQGGGAKKLFLSFDLDSAVPGRVLRLELCALLDLG